MFLHLLSPKLPSGLPRHVRVVKLNLTQVKFRMFIYKIQNLSFSVEDQRLHFKLDWHRFNLKSQLAGKSIVSEEAFEKQLSNVGSDEESEISASDSETEEEDGEEDSLSVSSRPYLMDSRVYFVSRGERILSVHKCLVMDSKARDVPSESELEVLLTNLPYRLTWAVLMLAGGHFAGAVFRGGEVLAHKTFHAYTVRAKQGGSQSSADNKSGSSHPKSAGASLRRYNEMSLLQHIQDIMTEWEEHFKVCQLVFYRATASNRNKLFGANSSVIPRNDLRLRNIPFQTRRPTFKEVKRVHELLSRVDIVGDVQEADKILNKVVQKQEKSPKKRIHRSKSREAVSRPLPDIVSRLAAVEDSDSGGEDLALVTEEFATSDLMEFDQTPVRKGRRSKNKKGAGIQRDLESLDLESSEEDEKRKKNVKLENDLLTAVKSGNNKMLEELVQSLTAEEEEVSVADLVNHQFGESRTSALHLAARHGHKNIVWTLLMHGADPSLRDKQKKVPFMVAETKDTRNMFRKFMGEFPDRYDYKTAQIPAPASKEEEEEKLRRQKEKKKAQRAAKQEKEKQAKAEEKQRKAEVEEKERFLNLSDREKRALAAERRLLGTGGGAALPKQRCFRCGVDITGKTPFEYSDYKFCSIGCVKKHREQK